MCVSCHIGLPDQQSYTRHRDNTPNGNNNVILINLFVAHFWSHRPHLLAHSLVTRQRLFTVARIFYFKQTIFILLLLFTKKDIVAKVSIVENQFFCRNFVTGIRSFLCTGRNGHLNVFDFGWKNGLRIGGVHCTLCTAFRSGNSIFVGIFGHPVILSIYRTVGCAKLRLRRNFYLSRIRERQPVNNF